MDLEALADFNAVASHGGFAKASRATGRPKATLSRRVKKLEDALGVRLIERGSRILRLTEEGVALHEQTAALMERIDGIKETIKTEVGLPHGRLRVSAPLLFAERGLGRIAATYARAYPDVQLEITADDRFIDPVIEGYDLVIRANPKPTTDLAGRCFLSDELIVVAHPSINRPAAGAKTFTAPTVMLLAATDERTWKLAYLKGSLTLTVKPMLRLSSMAMVHDAVLCGAGAAMMPRSLVQLDLVSGRLVEWGRAADRKIEVWALYPPNRHISKKVSAFVKMLTEQFVDASPAAFRKLMHVSGDPNLPPDLADDVSK